MIKKETHLGSVKKYYLASIIFNLSSSDLISLSISFTSNANNLYKESILSPRLFSTSKSARTQPLDLYHFSSSSDNLIPDCPMKTKNEKINTQPVIKPWTYDFIVDSILYQIIN